MANSTFTGGEKLKAKLSELSKKVQKSAIVQVGFFSGASEPNGASTPMVAAIQEFGAPAKGIPPRPYFRTMVAKEQVHWGDDLASALISTEFDSEVALDIVGSSIEGELRQSIVSITEPKLSDVTLLLRQKFGNSPQDITFADVLQARGDVKGGVEPNVTASQAKPLVWTGSMLNSITHKVE